MICQISLFLASEQSHWTHWTAAGRVYIEVLSLVKEVIHMKQTQKNLLAVAGVISSVLGIMGAIPSFLQEKYTIASVFTVLVVGGIILLALAFGD